MRHWQCDPATGLKGLRWTEMPDLIPAQGEALVAISAASLNFPDLLLIAGKYQWQPPPPFTPGTEFAGTVVALDSETTGFSIGDRVMSVGTTGGFATHALVPVGKLKVVPPGFSFVEASLLLVAYGTACHGLLDRGALQAGETVLVLGAAGGVGTAAIQVSKGAGARVIAAVSSDEKAALCRRLGADATINYVTEDLRTALRAIVSDGPNVVFDPVGGALAEPAFRSIAWRGRYLVIGFAGGDIPRLPLNLTLLKGAALVGVFWGAFDSREPKASLEVIAQLARGRADGWLWPVVDRVMPMNELPTACASMESRAVHGKIVLVNDPS
jgi:NADPH2:quinone reductase